MTVPSTAATGPAALGRRITVAWQGISSIARSGSALVLGSLIASALGMVFWALAARLLSPEQVGLGAALISAIFTLSHASQLNLRNLLHRFVPGAGTLAPMLIYRSYAGAAVVAFTLGTGFALLVPAISPELAFLGQSPLASTGFVAALMIWTLYSLQEAALTAQRLAAFVPLQSLIYSLTKIVCLAVLAMTAASASSIVVAWIAPALVIGLLTHVLASARSQAAPPSAPTETVGWREVTSFFGWDYVGAVATSLSLGIAPIIVVSLSGAADVAPYYLAWSITYTLYLVSRHVGAAMLAELATNAGRRRALYAETIVLTIVPVSIGVAVILLLAPQIMLIFGPAYIATGSEVLRILALASIPTALVTAHLAICRAEGWVRMVALLQVTTLVALILMGVPLTALLGPTGMAWAWLGASGVAAMVIVAVAFARYSRLALLGFAVDLTSAVIGLARQVEALLPRRRPAAAAVPIEVAGRLWTIDGAASVSLSDATTLRVTSMGGEPGAAVLKRATTAPGREALRREHAMLLHLAKDSAAATMLGRLVPEPLHFEECGAHTTLLMSALPGADARRLVRRPEELNPALASINERMAALHAAAGAKVAPTAGWLNRWIDEPLARVATLAVRHRNIAAIRAELHHVWGRSELAIGPGHGDFCPDNLLLERDLSSGLMQPSGLVDWGGFRADAPAGLDACTMAMTVRAAAGGRQLGQVVLELLDRPAWTAAELEWMGSGGHHRWMSDTAELRALVLLAWLQHIDANLGKSVRYSGRSYWGFANVTLVVEGFAHAAD